MTSPYQITRYRPEFRDRVLRLQTHLWSPDLSLNEAYMRWKHEQNPYLSESLIYLALRGADVVGMRALFGTRWQIGSPSETFDALYSDDLVVLPEHRNQRLPAQMMRAAFDDLASEPFRYAVSLSAGSVAALISLSMGWKSVGPMLPVGRVSPRTTLFRAVRRRMNRNPLPTQNAVRAIGSLLGMHRGFSRIDRVIAQQEGRIGAHVTAHRVPRCEAMADLVQSLPYDGRIRHVRDAAYLRWRFGKPTGDYRFLYQGRDRLEGYLVLQTDRVNQKWRVRIVDWEARDENVRVELLHAALACGGFAELVTWTATLTPAVRGLLQDAGFEPVDRKATARGLPSLLLRPIGREPSNEDWILAGRRLLDLSQWDLRLIYSMHG